MATAYHLMRQHQNKDATKRLIDLRSDTVTLPSAEMKEWMMSAPLGDDVYGEDQTINLLEQTVAQKLGKEAGLFVSSGTQSNLLAMLSHCGRGEEYLVGDQYHIYVDEAGGPAVLGSLVSCVLETNELGALAPEQIRNAIKEDDPHYAITRLLCLENTVGGVAQSVESLRQLTATAKEGGLLCHLDGARLMNAAVALGVEASKIADSFDSVCMCLSKGLGAPVGSVLSGSKDFINRARRNRKLVGGGMRQAGILAAAGLYALEHNIARLAQDHAKAAQLAESLADIEQLKVTQHTNMVFIELSIDDQISFLEHMAKHDILIGAPAPVARLVAHLDTTEADIEKVAIVVRKYFHH